MEQEKFYTLPDLDYGYKELEPYISEEQLKIHHEKHHDSYVQGANSILKKLTSSRNDDEVLDLRSVLKSLSFNIGGHILHSLFWKNLAPATKENNQPNEKLTEIIEDEYGSFERFQKEFNQVAISVEGSGWAALTYCNITKRPLLMQIEKHNTNVYPMFDILLIVDVFEHSYYIDYKNERAKYVENIWNIINWGEVNKRLESKTGTS